MDDMLMSQVKSLTAQINEMKTLRDGDEVFLYESLFNQHLIWICADIYCGDFMQKAAIIFLKQRPQVIAEFISCLNGDHIHCICSHFLFIVRKYLVVGSVLSGIGSLINIMSTSEAGSVNRDGMCSEETYWSDSLTAHQLNQF